MEEMQESILLLITKQRCFYNFNIVDNFTRLDSIYK